MYTEFGLFYPYISMFFELLSIDYISLKELDKKFLEQYSFKTVYDVIYFFPKKHEKICYCIDLESILDNQSISSQQYCIKLKIVSVDIFNKGGKKTICIKGCDKNGIIVKCIWINALFIYNAFVKRKEITIVGKLYSSKEGYMFYFPKIVQKDITSNYCEMISRYNFPTERQEKKFKGILKDILINYSCVISSLLPYRFDRETFFWMIHFPEDYNDVSLAMQFFSSEKCLLISTLFESRYRKKASKNCETPTYNTSDMVSNATDIKLRDEQVLAVNRMQKISLVKNGFKILLHGEVGSGKTITAFIFALQYVLEKKKVIFLEPTLLLAHQTYKRILEFCNKINKKYKYNINVGIMTSDTKNSDGDIIIGTHALLYNNKLFENLNLFVVDEEHKFGVVQREYASSISNNCNMLFLSATPIPRTMSLVLQNDIDVVFLRGVDRRNVKTYICYLDTDVWYDTLKKKIDNNQKVIFIVPFLKNSDIYLADMTSLANYLVLCGINEKSICKISGKMSKQEQKTVFDNFTSLSTYSILIATTIAELGLDIPNLNYMFIVHANMFGLSSLHQMRGRIGRQGEDAECFLLVDKDAKESSVQKLHMIKEINDGFQISKNDLKIRGSGNIFGKEQSGNFGYENVVYTSYVKYMTDLEVNMISKMCIETILKDDFLGDENEFND